jgi:uncharacterized protein involved in outer membrane biogenesis
VRSIAKAALVIVGLITLIAGGGLLYLSFLDVNRFRGVIAEKVKAATGRELTIAGDLDLKLGLPIALTAAKVRLANALWGSRPDMATVDRAEIAVAVLPLLRGTLRIDTVTVEGLDLLLETDAAGDGNWMFTTPAPSATTVSTGGGSPASSISLADIDVAASDSRITYRDGEAETARGVAIDRLTLQAKGAGAPVAVRLDAQIDAAPLTARGTIGPLADLIDGEAPYPVSLRVETPGLAMTADGVLAKPLDFAGLDLRFTIEAADLATAAAPFGFTLPSLQHLSAAGRFTDADGGYAVNGLTITAGSGEIAGDVKIRLDAPRPSIAATLKGSRLDLREFVGHGGGGGQPARLPFDALTAADADVRLDVGTLELPRMTLQTVTLGATVADGRLDATAHLGGVGGGTADATLQADRRDALASVHMTTNGVALGPVLHAFGVDVLEGGPTDAVIDLAGRGRTVPAWIASAGGRVDLHLGPAIERNRMLSLLGGDLVTNVLQTVNPFARTDDVTRIQCGVLRAPVASGRLTFDRSLAVETDKLGAIASGSIDVARRRLDLAVRTQAREGLGVSLASIATLFVGIGGTFDRPTVQATPLSGIIDIGRFALTVAGEVATLDASGLSRLLFTDRNMCQVAAGAPASSSQGGWLKEVPANVGSAAEKAGHAAGKALRNTRRDLERLFGD